MSFTRICLLIKMQWAFFCRSLRWIFYFNLLNPSSFQPSWSRSRRTRPSDGSGRGERLSIQFTSSRRREIKGSTVVRRRSQARSFSPRFNIATEQVFVAKASFVCFLHRYCTTISFSIVLQQNFQLQRKTRKKLFCQFLHFVTLK